VSVSFHVSDTITFKKLVLPTDISFKDFHSKVCAEMGLEPQTASLGYMFNMDLCRAPRQDPASGRQLHAAVDKGANLIECSCACRMVLEIQNMVVIL
jgi:hypothetical protein